MGKCAVDLTGKRFDRLLVLQRHGSNNQREVVWLCLCDCGREVTMRGITINNGTFKSCGCHHIERLIAGNVARTTHGLSRKRSPEYDAWRSAKARCFSPKHVMYPDYGGRGITMFQEWRYGFLAFLSHIGPRPSALHSLDRIDVNGNYEPGNVRWATRTEQQLNRRKLVHHRELDAVKRKLAQYEEMYGPLETA